MKRPCTNTEVHEQTCANWDNCWTCKEECPEPEKVTFLHALDDDVIISQPIPVETEPTRCINCGAGDEVDWGMLESDGGSAWRDPVCNTCGTTWEEVYTIRTIEHIEIHNNHKETT